MKNIINKILTAFLALLFCGVCMANIAVPKTEYSENENRYLSQLPKATIESIKNAQFMENFEKYTSDQFILRDFFVSLKAKIERLLLKTENNGVYFAKDNYLIQKHENYKDDIMYSNIEALKQLSLLKRYKINLAVVPSAYEILSDKLPKNAYKPVYDNAVSKIEDKIKDTKISFINTKDILIEHKDEYIYYRTDHHQTALGGYYVYKALGESLGYNPLEITDFDVEEVNGEFLGTTWSKAMLNKNIADTISRFVPKNEMKYSVSFPYEDKKSDDIYFNNRLSEKDKYTYYLDGNHGLTVAQSGIKNGRKLAVIKDSYAHNIVPFLLNHYEKVYMIDLRYFNTDILEYFWQENITDILTLYSFSSFMTDNNLSKLYSWCENSPYANQPYGLVYETEAVGDEYFSDAIFVGDSLTEGLKLYNTLNPKQFLSYVGMSLYGINNLVFPNEAGEPVYSAIDLIAPSNANKIYIMLGTNDEISPKAQQYYLENYSNFIDNIRKYRPDAMIYIQSILPVTPKKELEGRFKNEYIYMYNEALKNMAREKKCYYLNILDICADTNGNMISEISPDGIHLDITHYRKWLTYLKTHAVDDSRFTNSGNAYIPPVNVQVPSTDEIKSIAQALVSNVPFKDKLWMLDNSIGVSTYGISSELLNSAVVYAGSGATAEEVGVFEFKDEKARDEILAKINEHLLKRKNSFEDYLPSEVVKLSSPFIKVTNKYVILCVSDYNDKAQNALNSVNTN